MQGLPAEMDDAKVEDCLTFIIDWIVKNDEGILKDFLESFLVKTDFLSGMYR